MKGKIKLELVETSCFLTLKIRLKIEGELFYWHTDNIIRTDDTIYENGRIKRIYRSTNEFYDEVIKYISDINNIKRDGERLMREVLGDKLKKLKNQSKEKQTKRLLKELNKPIIIEIKE